MDIGHTGLYVKEEKIADRFFTGLLGIEKEAEFAVSDELSSEIFGFPGIKKGIIYSLGNCGKLEVFTGKADIAPPLVNHICLFIKNIDEITSKAHNMGFEIRRFKRDNKPDIIFILDDYGNMYEMKQA